MREDVIIHAGTGDTQAAYLGSGCQPGDLLLNFGTGSQSIWETSNPVATPGTDVRYLQHGRFLVTAPAQAGGQAYRIAAEFFQECVHAFSGMEISIDATYQIMNDLALNSSSSGVMFDPIFLGSKFREGGERASITGLTHNNFQPGPIICALIEGMLREVADPFFVREGERPPARLMGAGNAMRGIPALREAAEHLFGLPLLQAEENDDAAFGVSKLAN
jgi:xylulokinase